MIVATVLVILMTIPGLALFYGGLVRSKNMLSVLMQVFTIFCLIAVLWVVYGYSLAFSPGGGLNSFIGGLDKLFMKGITPDSTVETFSKGVVIPEYIFVMFQLTFAAITTALIAGAYAERIKFSAVLVFSALWFTLSYLPISHMVWFWGGPSAPNDPAGFLFAKGRARFRRRHGGAHQRRYRRPDGRARTRQALGLSQDADATAQPHHDHDRRLYAVGRLVRL